MLVHRLVLRTTVATQLDVTRGLSRAQESGLLEMCLQVSVSEFRLQLRDALSA
jgi:hypothetical protein